MKKLIIVFSIAAVAGLVGCKKEYLNPNEPTDTEVLNSPDGLTKLMVGIKQRFAVNGAGTATLYQSISASALSTGEVTVLNAGNADLAQLQNGRNNLAPVNGVITSLWSTSMVVISESDKVINSAGVIPSPAYRNGILAYAHLYKAMAIGTLAQFWEQLPIAAGANAQFVPRQQALTEAVRLLDDAAALIGNTPLPAELTTQVGNQIDLRNSLLALSARYNNMLGNHDAAIARATAASRTVRSTFWYNLVNPNPVFRSALVNNNTFGIVNNFGLSGALLPNSADGRIVFHLTRNAQNGSGFFAGDASAIPVYLPGEMSLILAEAHARKNDFTNAKRFLDEVLTKTTDAFGLGANLTAYSGPMTQADLLFEIYKNRCIELYMSGMKLEDSRRFGRPGPGSPNAERTRNFYPYPQQERDGNRNTPADPAD